MSADSLSLTSRDFYERSKMKLAFSVTLGGGALLCMGMCSSAGGESASNGDLQTGDDDGKLESLKSGYGFASFCYIIGFFLILSAALYLSPLVSGSNNEKKMINAPQEIDSGFGYADNAPSAPPV